MSNESRTHPDLTPKSDNSIIIKLHQERKRHEEDLKAVKQELKATYNKLFQTRQRLKEELIKSHRSEYDVFINKLMNLKTVELMVSEEYSLLKHNLLEQLRHREIDNSTYRKLLRESGKKANLARKNVLDFFSSEIERIFGEDKTLFNLNNLDKY